ncbi:hypothetical protein JG687_00010903 [Phytophthora cactorum]|uniref:Uncharacterized protein n=1 Tax=Phytophthora cactorum TaxID=29920 RepID=A0A8T1UB26_9STRA|nr:hypothetical protein JG687_00010903 [Phytophthora cactorum]
MCLQGLRPWFAVNTSCYTHGVLSPPIDALDHLQGDAVTAIVFEHCPEFDMPPAIRRFPNLLGLELWNVSIIKWDADAALNADLYLNMFYLIMAYTNMTEMPQGVLTKPLPPLLGDIEISVTNLEVVPDELADAWSNVRLVYLEHAPLKEFPTALFSLLDDGLETIPEDLFTTVSLLDEYLEICFSYNPIKNLPFSTRESVFINYLGVDHTDLTQLPAWALEARQWINLGGCPICNDTEATLPEVADCTDWGWNPMVDGRFPLALVAPFRKIIMVVVAEGGGFVVERASFCSVPPISTDVQPPSTSKTDPLSTFEFVVVWLLVLALHGLCASYLLAMALLYFFMENPLMAYYANLLALPEHRYFRLFGTLVGILGALHGLQLVLHLLWSIKSRAPAVFPRAAMINRLKSKKTEPVAPRPSWSRNSITAIGSVTASGLQSVLSVEGNHFALVFVTRKAVEVGAQIVQCYRYSTLIGRVWINHAYAGMVVTNCWVTPLLDYLMLASEAQVTQGTSTRNANVAGSIRERVACVSVDALLTAFACLVLPLAIFVPYAQVFDVSWYSFPNEILYGDVSFPNLIRENQALFALSFVDGVTKLVPHLSILTISSAAIHEQGQSKSFTCGGP